MKTQIDSRRPEHLDALRQALLRMRRATRAQLAEETGLSAMTVGKLLALMQARGEVFQDETMRLAGGRPSVIAQYNGDYAHFAAIVVEQREGKSAFTLSIYDLFGEPVFSEELLLDTVKEDCFDAFFDHALQQGYRLALAVLVLPGVAEGDEIVLCDLEALVRGQVIRRIRDRFGIDVLFENDVNGAVFGHAFGTEAGTVCAGVYFPKNYCPGAGVVVEGKILCGHGHFAGELGYIQGIDAWESLNYGDTERTAQMIAQLLVVYACTTAPRCMVLYGDFFTAELRERIETLFALRMMGRYAMELTYETGMSADMERGAVRLGLARMRCILGRRDKE